MLHVHRAERADALADALAGILGEPLADPFAPEIVAVPTRGMERWLTQRFSTRLGTSAGRGDGVCANVDFPFPGTLVGAALAQATGLDPDADPWLGGRPVWPLLDVVDGCIGEPWLAALANHLGVGAPESPADTSEGAPPATPSRRFATVRHLADLYDRYAIRRPEMVCAWARGFDTDGADGALPRDGAWQAELWRRLRAEIGTPSPAERLAGACERIRSEPDALELPARIALFGLTRLPASYLRVLDAVAAGRDVHLFVLHPSPALWEAVARVDLSAGRAGKARPGAPGPAAARVAWGLRRAEDPTATLPRNRILASWGQDARELQLVVAGGEGPRADHHHEAAAPDAPTLLARLQGDIRADRSPPPEDERPALDPDDRSVQIHACHGRARQVEVIRDAILHLLQQDPTLEPRDVIVMCPDIETVAPLIQATFGAGRVERDDHDDDPDAPAPETPERLPDLRVRLADRSLRQTNPVLSAISQLLELADQRATASQLLDLADREPVRRRFRFDDDDVTRLQEWVVQSGIRWGLDAGHRRPYRLDVTPAGTWRTGLDRILLGVTLTEEDRRLVAGTLPLDDVESGAIDLAGRLAEFVDRIETAVDALTGPQPIAGWAAAIAAAADALTATGDRDSWQRGELQRILDDVLTEARSTSDGETTTGAPTSSAELGLADVRALLADRLRGRPTRANFRTGHLTVCTLVPMRSVPHRVVCILGLDDGEFPRKAPRDGDDLLLADPHLGDRDPRTEDRQMLLDALMAATERLIVTYTGNDPRTNLQRPPAVPVAELLDTIDRTVSPPAGPVRAGGATATPARDHVLVHHPLQPFDPRNFLAGELVAGTPWSFDQTALAGARALHTPRHARSPFLAEPLAPTGEPLIELERLVAFVERPVRAFLRQRLGVTVSEYADELSDSLPVELDALEKWGVAQRLLEGVLAGAPLSGCIDAEIARGALPPGTLRAPVLNEIRPRVEQIAAEAARHASGSPSSLDVNLRLPDGRTLAGTVPGVHGDTIRRVAYSRVNARTRLAAWVRLLALTATRPERPFSSVVIGRIRQGSDHGDVTVARIAPLGEDAETRANAALAHLTTLVDLYDRGMREPLPLACEASAAYARAALSNRDAEAAGRSAWESGFRFDKEDREPEHLLVHGGQLTFEELLAEPPREDELAAGWPQYEQSRFGRYALRLWEGLLAREKVGDA